MKKLLFFLFFIISFYSFAQLDREHWFAPMVDRTSNGSQYQSIYLSSNDPTPFNVDIYFNNAVVSTVTVSKGNPVKYSIPAAERNQIITRNQSDLFTPVSKGYYLKGEKPFFASFRFSILNHGEILTSKGTAGIGTEFRAVMAPITAFNGILNFMTSVMATEDNTVVTISDFNANILFSDNLRRTSFNFTLNKGESYIIDGIGNYFENHTGFIGAKIVASKPITITNGNFNGQYATTSTSSSDILMDQGVPIDKLGVEFVLMKGNGSTTSAMEKGMIVATEDNTEIYINNGTTPAATLNAGEFYLTDNSAYVNPGVSHYNMLIKATKNIYVYQLLAGDGGSSEVATGGFNYIPPLNCYLPQKIDEIGKIDENEYSSNNVGYSTTVPTKLNIITETGATIDVKRNGISMVLTASNGPFAVTGNPNWVTYSISNIYGNVGIFSSKAVTAGISAGNDAVGYGGYFVGFSSIPLILKVEGECLPGVKLAVTAGFTSYQWLMKDLITSAYVPAPGVNNTFEYIPTQAGIYAVEVQQGSCAKIQTGDFKFYNCTTFTNYDYQTCTAQTITPKFALSSQSVDSATLKIDTAPKKGTVTINPNGTLTYTANPNEMGSDTFKYYFCGVGAIPDCETVQATIQLNQIEKYDAVLNECSATSTATFNLPMATLTPNPGVTKKYFRDAAFSSQIPAAQLTNYTSAVGFVYVQLTNTFGCTADAKIELKITATPTVNPALHVQTTCDEDIDGMIDGNYKVDLSTITPTIVQNANDFTVRYYENQPQAIAGGNNNITGNFNFTANTSVWIRVDSPAVCPPVIKEVFLKIATKANLLTSVATAPICDLLYDNSEPVDLADYHSLFTLAAGSSVTYFSSLLNAQNNQNGLASNQIITGDQTFYYRISVPGFCENIGTLNLELKKGTPTALLNSYSVCEGASLTLKAESTYTAYLWKKGATAISTTDTAILDAGIYTIYFTDVLDCVFTKTITVVESPKAKWNIAAYNATHCDDNFEGLIKINLNNVTPIILPNFNLFTVEYFRNPDFTGKIQDLANFTYSANIPIYVRATSPLCPLEFKTIDFKVGNSLSLLNSSVSEIVCDDDFDGVKDVTLSNYISEFTTDSSVAVSYFGSLADAQKNVNLISNAANVTNSATYYLRFHKNGFCDGIGKLMVTVQKAKKSDLLVDQNICAEATAILDAGSGFDSYSWSTGETSSSIEVSVGEYWVDLSSNGCVYRQKVSVKAVALEIKYIEIKGSTVTINVSGGNPPYQYAIDGFNYQSSNVFTNVRGGNHTIYVISAEHCEPVSAEINVIELYNVITPNGDGVNDVLNYSSLLKKEEPYLQIFDRYGKIAFTGNQNNRYSWDGKAFGKSVSTGSYWFVIKWEEPGSGVITEYSGWILVKNRE